MRLPSANPRPHQRALSGLEGAQCRLPDPVSTSGALGTWWVLLASCALAVLPLRLAARPTRHPHTTPPAPTAPGPASPAPATGDTQKTEAQLEAVKSEIERVARQVSNDEVEKSRLNKERESDLSREREALAAQLRAAYMIGREEPLKLLLNQKDPERAGRMFAYYGYFGRARAGEIHEIEDNVQSLAQLDAQLEAEDGKLAELEKSQRARLADLEEARQHRSVVLASLEAESHTRAESLERLRSQQAGLEKLLKELRRALERLPTDTNDAFARLRGKLAWPVSGRVLARFGETRAGGVKWDGVLVATERGAPVRAISPGRVIYADWLPGLGLLTIIDHGNGYMSLYGHNEQLYKAVGEQVAAGDAIAAAGDSGGTPRPELYFEIRKAGHPIDPRPWFRDAAP